MRCCCCCCCGSSALSTSRRNPTERGFYSLIEAIGLCECERFWDDFTSARQASSQLTREMISDPRGIWKTHGVGHLLRFYL
uniref:Putative secreted protein n=1 Tax=Anopheles marajoara TaxID=58244 RepID=A0A2M4CBG8_9DIPT